MPEILKEKQRLVEEIGVHFEKTHQLPPLAARIYALMMLCPEAGHTFDTIMELSQASKSSVSTNINLLLKSGNIEYFTKTGQRKRFFRLSKNYLEVNLKEYEERVSEELFLLDKISTFNYKNNKQKHKKHQKFGRLYRDYLESHHKNLKNTIKKMNELEQ